MSRLGATLGQLVDAGVGAAVVGDRSTHVSGVQHDSRNVVTGDLFAAIAGLEHDGASFAPDAVARGASAILCERELSHRVPQLICSNVRATLGRVSEIVYGAPTSKLSVTGVTGTNGKTTVVHLLGQILGRAGRSVASMGTITNAIGARRQHASHTTAEADDLSRFAAQAVDAGAEDLLIEVSSHGLALARVDGVRFAVAAFTNLTQDHLDFHKTMAAYGEAKARLFLDLDPGVCVINVDDRFGADLADRVAGATLRCSTRGADADLCATDAEVTRDGLRATLRYQGDVASLRSPVVGIHNLDNLVTAIGCALALGHPFAEVVRWAGDATGAPGRLQSVKGLQGVASFVDYAHTTDALARVCSALAPLTRGRLIVVFGAGGDRDKTKRAPMGRAVGEGAEIAIVTSDNPRTENPEAIMSSVIEGLVSVGVPAVDEPSLTDAPKGYVGLRDRADAIALAVDAAKPGDTILVAGKGHETEQIIGTERLPFDDRVVLAQAIARRQERR